MGCEDILIFALLMQFQKFSWRCGNLSMTIANINSYRNKHSSFFQNVPVHTAKDWADEVKLFCEGKLPMTNHSFIKQDNINQKVVASDGPDGYKEHSTKIKQMKRKASEQKIGEPLKKQRKKSVDSKSKFQCPYCDSKIGQKHNFKSHVKKKHEEEFSTTDFSKLLLFNND